MPAAITRLMMHNAANATTQPPRSRTGDTGKRPLASKVGRAVLASMLLQLCICLVAALALPKTPGRSLSGAWRDGWTFPTPADWPRLASSTVLDSAGRPVYHSAVTRKRGPMSTLADASMSSVAGTNPQHLRVSRRWVGWPFHSFDAVLAWEMRDNQWSRVRTGRLAHGLGPLQADTPGTLPLVLPIRIDLPHFIYNTLIFAPFLLVGPHVASWLKKDPDQRIQRQVLDHD